MVTSVEYVVPNIPSATSLINGATHDKELNICI